MALKVIINKGQSGVRVREGVSKAGRNWKMVSQSMYVFLPGMAYPDEMVVTLPDGVSPYPDGEYECDFESMLSKDRYASPLLDTRKFALVRVK